MLRLSSILVGPLKSQSQTLQHPPIKPASIVHRRKSVALPPAAEADLSVNTSNQKPSNSYILSAMATPSGELATTRPSITHVIFDMDGLLLDTEDFYSKVQEVILAKYGKTFDWSLKAKMMGKKALESARIFVHESGIAEFLTPEQFLMDREDMLLKLFPTCNLMPGVSRLVTHLHTKRIPMSVATGSDQRYFELKTQNHGDIFSLMHHVVKGDDPEVKKGKPSPDIFLAAARRFEGGPVDPSKILVFEDAPAGVGAAKNAGIIWIDGSKTFSVRQAFKDLLSVQDGEGFPASEVWLKQIPTRVSVLIWVVVQGKALTLDNLKKRGLSIPNRCYLCKEEEEDYDHLFGKCSFSIDIWKILTYAIEETIGPSYTARDILIGRKCRRLGRDAMKIWKFLLHAWWWHVWRERNKRAFNGKESNQLQVAVEVISTLWNWCRRQQIFCGVSRDKFICNWDGFISMP